MEISGLKSIVSDIPAPDVNQFVTEIRAFLQPAREVVFGNQNIGQLGVGTDCPRPDKDQFFNCLVRAKVMRELSVPYTQGPRAIVPLMAVVDPNLAHSLETKINKTITDFDNILSTDPGWWQELTKKFHVGEQFKKIVEDLLKEINALIESKSKQLETLIDSNIEQEKKLEAEDKKLDGELANLRQINNTALTNIKGIGDKIKNTMSGFEKIEREITATKANFNTTNKALETLNKRLEQITSEKVDVTNRLKNVESPFGTLPVGLNEALQVFPIVAAIGALMYWIILSELINLRCKYHMTLRHKYSSDHTIVDSNVVLFTPLFIDPLRRLLSNLWRGCVLAIPMVVYVAAVFLIMYSWSLEATAKGTSTVIRNVYIAVYIISFFLFFGPISRVVIQWRIYRNRFSSISE